MNKAIKLKKIAQNYGIVICLVFLSALLSIVTPNFLTYGNLITILRQLSCIGIATLGMGCLIIMGGIDLSLGSVFALSGVSAGMVVSLNATGLGMHPVVGYAVGIGIGAVIGFVNGFIIAKGKIPPFIVTMGTMSIGRGLAMIVAHGMPVGKFPDGFNYLGSATIDPWGKIPWLVVIFVIVAIVVGYILTKRPMGRYIYAIGSNTEAAKVAGINVDWVKIKAYLLEGVLVGLAGTLLASRLKSASPTVGEGYEMDAIAGCIVGGVSMAGGIGKVRDMLIGAMLIAVINNGMDLLSVEAFYKKLVKGSIIILAVLIDRYRSGRD